MTFLSTAALSAGFVEQYSRLKSLNAYSAEADIHFVRLEVGKEHPWLNQSVSGLSLPPGLLMAAIQRRGKVVVPRGDTVIQEGDSLILGAESYQDEEGIQLREIVLKENHPWVNQEIRELDLSRKTLIVMVRRDGKLMIPTGTLKLQAGDMILLYTKKNYREMQILEV